METALKNSGAYITSEFFLSKRVSKFKTIFDARSNNTIVMLDFDRGTVYEAAEFYEYVNNLIEKENVRIIIDLENIYFIDSVFFGSLIKLLKQADKKFGYIKLIVDHKSKPELLSISNFEGIFEIYPNLFEAIDHNKAV